MRLGDARPRLGPRRVVPGQAEIERLGPDQQFDRDDPLDVLEDGPGVSGGDRAHRDVVLLVRARRHRIDRRRMGEDLVLGGKGGGRVLDDHHPGIEAARRREEGRQTAVEALVEEEGRPALADRPELREGDLGEVEREGDRFAVEIPAADHESAAGGHRGLVDDAALRKDERIVGRAVHLDVEDTSEVVERVPDRAVNLRHAAERIRVLDLVSVALVAVLERRVPKQVTQLRRDRDLAGVRASELVGGGERDIRAEERLDAESSRHARCPRQPIGVGEQERADRAHELGAVQEREALLRPRGRAVRAQPRAGRRARAADGPRARPARGR